MGSPGSPPPQQPMYAPQVGYSPPLVPTNRLEIAGMVLGILSVIFLWFYPIGLPTGVVGLILSAIGMGKPFGKGFALAGLVCSIVGLGLTLLFLIGFVA